MGKERNFGNKINTNGFDKNPQNRNNKGQPRKGISLVIQKLKEEGFQEIRKQDIEATYLSLINLPKNKLEELMADEDQPILIKILIKNIAGGDSFDVIEKMLDRAIGKPKQVTEEIGNKQNIEIKLENQKLLDSLILE